MASSLDPTPPGAPQTPPGCSPGTSEVPSFQHLPGAPCGAERTGQRPLGLQSPSPGGLCLWGGPGPSPKPRLPPDPETLAYGDREGSAQDPPTPTLPRSLTSGPWKDRLSRACRAEVRPRVTVRVRARVLISGALGSHRRQVLPLRLQKALWALPQPPFVAPTQGPGALGTDPLCSEASWQGNLSFPPTAHYAAGPHALCRGRRAVLQLGRREGACGLALSLLPSLSAPPPPCRVFR